MPASQAACTVAMEFSSVTPVHESFPACQQPNVMVVISKSDWPNLRVCIFSFLSVFNQQGRADSGVILRRDDFDFAQPLLQIIFKADANRQRVFEYSADNSDAR